MRLESSLDLLWKYEQQYRCRLSEKGQLNYRSILEALTEIQRGRKNFYIQPIFERIGESPLTVPLGSEIIPVHYLLAETAKPSIFYRGEDKKQIIARRKQLTGDGDLCWTIFYLNGTVKEELLARSLRKKLDAGQIDGTVFISALDETCAGMSGQGIMEHMAALLTREIAC